MRRRALASLVALASGCVNPFAPRLPEGAEPFTPPAVYARWWAMTEACSGRSGDLRAVRWYRLPGPMFTHRGEVVGGFWRPRGNLIVLAAEAADHGPSVRHEMLHALLRVPGHPRAGFLAACAPLVSCTGACVTDAGPWRAPAGYVVLPPDSLAVDSRAELRPAEADGQQWLALHVTVRNPRGHAVLTTAPPVGSATPRTFRHDVRGPTGGLEGGDVAADSSALFFQPFETKRRLYEFRVAAALTEHRVPPGTLLVRGGYAGRWAVYDTIAVRP